MLIKQTLTIVNDLETRTFDNFSEILTNIKINTFRAKEEMNEDNSNYFKSIYNINSQIGMAAVCNKKL